MVIVKPGQVQKCETRSDLIYLIALAATASRFVPDEVLLHEQLLQDDVVDSRDGLAVMCQEVGLGVRHRRWRKGCKWHAHSVRVYESGGAGVVVSCASAGLACHEGSGPSNLIV